MFDPRNMLLLRVKRKKNKYFYLSVNKCGNNNNHNPFYALNVFLHPDTMFTKYFKTASTLRKLFRQVLLVLMLHDFSVVRFLFTFEIYFSLNVPTNN